MGNKRGFFGKRSPEWQRRFGQRDIHPLYAQRQCTAKSKRSGKRCRMWAIKGSSRCRMHYGKLRKGFSSPLAKSGKYSKYILGAEFRERYEEAISSDTLISMMDEIGIIDARTSEIIGKLGTGETSELWDKLYKTWVNFMMAVRLGDSETQNNLLGTLNNLITSGHNTSNQWEELFRVVERRRKIVETENKRMATNRDMIPVQQVVFMLNLVIESARVSALKHADKKTAYAILSDAQETYIKLVGSGDSPRADSTVVDGEYTAR